MIENLMNNYRLISSEIEIDDFIENNANTLTIIKSMEPYLIEYFPFADFSLEICDNLEWTTESKLLVNVCVCEEMFFNGMLNHFNNIYMKIEPLIEDILCPIVLFPEIKNKKFDKYSDDCIINLIAKTAYFNNSFDKNHQREMTIRTIPKAQQKREIIEYCKAHENPNFSDIVFDLQLDIFDVDEMIDEITEEGLHLNINY